MSVVAVKVYQDHYTMASDSIMVHGWGTQTKDKTFKFAKMFKIGELVVGSCGYVSEAAALNMFLREHHLSDLRLGEEAIYQLMWQFAKFKDEKLGSKEITNSWIIGTPKNVWNFEGGSCIEIKSHFAIGAGMDFALGALQHGASATEAVAVACELSTYCELPVLVETVNFAK